MKAYVRNANGYWLRNSQLGTEWVQTMREGTLIDEALAIGHADAIGGRAYDLNGNPVGVPKSNEEAAEPLRKTRLGPRMRKAEKERADESK